ncbi:hypothetical protein STCU_01378 [Strigomonas culicis]|nr:hypothetical protein STCU_01378 [Strigomonas culicis]|eukprot:EPY34724.1 hypothetical protein STCU_01378 [Strigomonas culicis]
MRVEAQRHRDIKFVSMISTEAIPNFPDRHLPCVLLYRNKEMKGQLTTLDPWKNGRSIDINTVESVLKRNGILPNEECEDD